jgi:hypothetical protein
LLDDIISCSHDEFGRIGEIFPIVGKDLIDECLLFDIFKDGRWKGLDVVFAGVIRVLDDGLVFRFFNNNKMILSLPHAGFYVPFRKTRGPLQDAD